MEGIADVPFASTSLFQPRKPDASEIEALKRKGDAKTLIRLLSHPDFDVQWQAADALGKIGVDAFGPLKETWYTTDLPTRLGAIEAIGEIRDPRAMPYLSGMIVRDEHPEVRWAAAIALGRMGREDGINPLVGALTDPDKYVRYGAAIGLDQIGWTPGTGMEEAAYLIAKQEWTAAEQTGNDAAESLERVLSDRDPGIRARAAEALGTIRGPVAVRACDRVLRDPDPGVRWKGVLAFQDCGVPLLQLPMAVSHRPKSGPSPYIAGFLNLLFLGLGYNYLGKWWGFLLFQIFATISLLAIPVTGAPLPYLILFFSAPYSIPFAIHGWWIGKHIPEL
ncbi:MAG: HEAT repeat domain-containing protein [Methanoregulaceae archaeon]|nr:HEAT repeat domain-containing protein [Methanoregulaceae archaeon]